MTWTDFYLVCFLAGFALSALSFLSGQLHWHLPHHGGGHAHIHHGHCHGGNQNALPFFNFATGSAFLAWFGGAGFLLTRYSSLWVWFGLGVAVASGLGGAWLVFWLVSRVLLRYERDLDPADYQMSGVLGRLSAPIREGDGTGEIIFSQQGARRTSPARSEEGIAIPVGVEVVVTRYQKGIAYVRRWDDLVNE
jgi:membrane protein implicated in regulation of membrane protease activity